MTEEAAEGEQSRGEQSRGEPSRGEPSEEAARYRLDVRQGVDWTFYGWLTLDAKGRFLSREIEGAGVTRYTPHNCEKVAGICEYTETAPDGSVQAKARINGREGERWSYTIFDDTGEAAEVRVVGTVRYGPDGFATIEEWTETSGYQRDCARRVGGD